MGKTVRYRPEFGQKKGQDKKLAKRLAKELARERKLRSRDA